MQARFTKFGLVMAVLLWIAVACESADEKPAEFQGPEYFPLVVGQFKVYDIDSVRIIQNVETSFQYQVRLSVIDSFLNGERNFSYVLKRERRPNASSGWTAAGTWTAWKSNRQAVVTEGNQSFVKLQFPLSVGIQWNGNSLNSLGGDNQCNGSKCDTYEVTGVDPDVVVTQENELDAVVKYDVRLEKYSKGVGLVYKESTVFEYCTEGDCLGKRFVKNGIRFQQTLTDAGKL